MRLFILVMIAGLITLALGERMTNSYLDKEVEMLTLSMHALPTSVDPMQYDIAYNHVAFRALYGTLATKYKAGEYLGIVAESWVASDDHREWRFKIRENLTFENGDLITAEIVALSIKRTAFQMMKRESESGVFENSLDIESLLSPSSDIAGISSDNETLILSFTKSMPNLLDLISFGLYAIAHPSQFDHKTGEWFRAKEFISSGAYKIQSWDDKAITFQLRDDFPKELRHPDAFEVVKYLGTEEQQYSGDIFVGSERYSDQADGHSFFGRSTSGITYIRCMSWSHSDSPLSDINVRRFLKREFYKSLEKLGVSPVKSFFPLAIPGIRELSENDKVKEVAKSSFRPVSIMPIFSKSKLLNQALDAIKAGLNGLSIKSHTLKNYTDDLFFNEREPNLPDYKLDFSFSGTAILIDEPDSDIKFMINSKDGIWLPDPTGRLAAATKEDGPLDYQEINRIIWDDAIIWPYSHSKDGIWAKMDKVDLSMLNPSMPPVDYSWVGRAK